MRSASLAEPMSDDAAVPSKVLPRAFGSLFDRVQVRRILGQITQHAPQHAGCSGLARLAELCSIENAILG
jgi:hypothetical protein